MNKNRNVKNDEIGVKFVHEARLHSHAPQLASWKCAEICKQIFTGVGCEVCQAFIKINQNLFT